jgi:hypothetical protein
MVKHLANTSAKIAGSLPEHSHGFASLPLKLIAEITQVTEVVGMSRLVVALRRGRTILDRGLCSHLRIRLNKSTILSAIIRRPLRESCLVLVVHRPSPYIFRYHAEHTITSSSPPRVLSGVAHGWLNGKE